MTTGNDYLLWIRQAQHDLEQAEDSLKADKYDWSAYAAQQSAEKYIKGVLIFAGVQFEYTYQLTILVKQLEEVEIPVENLPSQDDLLLLTEQNQIARYPMNDLAPRDAVTESRAKKSITTAKSIQVFANMMIQQT